MAKKLFTIKNLSENKKITILKINQEKPKSIWLHKESIMKLLNIDWKQLQYSAQKTPANCGPLSIINWLYALTAFNTDFQYPKDFPRTSNEIRKLLVEDWQLRNTMRWFFGNEVSQDNHALVTDILYNIIKKLTEISNLEITWNRFKSDEWIPPNEVYNIIDNSDRIIKNSNFHYISYVKIGDNNRLCVDSMIPPYKITDKRLKETIKIDETRYIWIKFKKK